MKFFELAGLLSLLAGAVHPAFTPAAAPTKNPYCGEASWSIVALKSGNVVFNGKADCTTVEGAAGNLLMSNMGDEGHRLTLQVTYDASGSSTCASGRVTVDLVGVPGPPAADPTYSATGRETGPTRCDFDISDRPRGPGFVRGGLTGVLGRCPTGGCGKDSDWDLVSVNGGFDAYSRGQ